MATSLLLFAGLALLVGGGEVLIRGAVQMAQRPRMSPLVIGLTVVAFGTSAPELAVNMQAALDDKADLAVGNVVGSNIFNILFIAATTALVTATHGAVVPVSRLALEFDIPIAIATALACMPLLFTGMSLARWEGGLLLLYYFAYLAALILDALGHPHAHHYQVGMLVFVMPLTAVTLAVCAWGAMSKSCLPRP